MTMSTRNLEQSNISLTKEELFCAYRVLARSTRAPKDGCEKRLLNKILLKVDAAVIAVQCEVNK